MNSWTKTVIAGPKLGETAVNDESIERSSRVREPPFIEAQRFAPRSPGDEGDQARRRLTRRRRGDGVVWIQRGKMLRNERGGEGGRSRRRSPKAKRDRGRKPTTATMVANRAERRSAIPNSRRERPSALAARQALRAPVVHASTSGPNKAGARANDRDRSIAEALPIG
jgi:hypothetical protein